MRWIAVVLALLFAVPAAAQDKPAWVGVWEGKVGTYPVRLCMDQWGDGPARGAYYYLSQLEPIALSEEDGEGGWIAHGPTDPDELWSFTEQTGERLRGTWHRGSRSLPFDLKPVAWTPGEWEGPCRSAAFMEARLGDGTVESEEALLVGGGFAGSFEFLVQTYRPPSQLDEVSIETFSFAEHEPGDAALNAVLESLLPRGTLDDEFVACMSGAISSVGADGFFEHAAKPIFLSGAFLTFEETSSTFCGGAHPNYWTVYRTFDRQSGEEVDLFDWIGEPRIDGEDSALPEALRTKVVSALFDVETECAGLADVADYWSLGLREDGMLFWPDLPHAARACEASVLIRWDDMTPFLDAEGRAGLARLRGG